jgi:hypothetical protein
MKMTLGNAVLMFADTAALQFPALSLALTNSVWLPDVQVPASIVTATAPPDTDIG